MSFHLFLYFKNPVRYPIRLGLQTDVITAPQPSCLPLDEVTIGNEFQSAGYTTHIGKNFINESSEKIPNSSWIANISDHSAAAFLSST